MPKSNQSNANYLRSEVHLVAARARNDPPLPHLNNNPQSGSRQENSGRPRRPTRWDQNGPTPMSSNDIDMSRFPVLPTYMQEPHSSYQVESPSTNHARYDVDNNEDIQTDEPVRFVTPAEDYHQEVIEHHNRESLDNFLMIVPTGNQIENRQQMLNNDGHNFSALLSNNYPYDALNQGLGMRYIYTDEEKTIAVRRALHSCYHPFPFSQG